MNETTLTVHVQIGDGLPWVAISWRTFDGYDDLDPTPLAIYGPVPSKEAAEELAKTLTGMMPGFEALGKFTVMPLHAVVTTCPESAVVAG